jgi:16S rRNA C1402 N4-methylase RsmH
MIAHFGLRQMLDKAYKKLKSFRSQVQFQLGSYAELGAHLQVHGFPSVVDGILVDLGVNR